MWKLLLGLLSAVAILIGTARDARANEIKLATLAPKASPWGKVFVAWSNAVKSESNGALELTWYWNGVQGDEAAMLGKMRSRQLDGGALTGTGLSNVYRHILALQMPGLFSSWAKLDEVRERMRPRFQREFEAQGFHIVGTGDVGVARIMSRGRAVRVPDDLRAMHPFYLAGDIASMKFLEAVGVANPRALQVPAILPALSSRAAGSVDVLNTPCLAAEQLQWAPHVDHVNTMPTALAIGAVVVTKSARDGLPADARALFDRTGENAARALTDRIRRLDEEAFGRMKRTKTVVVATDTERAAWGEMFAKVRRTLRAEGRIDREVFDEVTKAASE